MRNALHILIGFIFGILVSFANLNLLSQFIVGTITLFIIASGWEMNQVYLTQRDSTFDWWDIVRAEVGFVIALIITTIW